MGNAKTERTKRARARKRAAQASGEPNWNGKCEVCGASPTHPTTGMCGPCTFGEADTVGGNW